MASAQESLGYTYKVDRVTSGRPGSKKVVFTVRIFDPNFNQIREFESPRIGFNRADGYIKSVFRDLTAEFGRMEEKDFEVGERMGNSALELQDEYNPVSWRVENLPGGQVKGIAEYRVGEDVVSIEMVGESEHSAFNAVLARVPEQLGKTRKSIFEGSSPELR